MGNPCMDLNQPMNQDNQCTANLQCMRSSLHVDKRQCTMKKIAIARAFLEGKLPWPRLEGWQAARQECTLLAIWMKLVALWKVLANGLVVQLETWDISLRRHLTIFSDVECKINANKLIRIYRLQCKAAHDRRVQAPNGLIYVCLEIWAPIGVIIPAE